jgi:hypothetical protein
MSSAWNVHWAFVAQFTLPGGAHFNCNAGISNYWSKLLAHPSDLSFSTFFKTSVSRFAL